MVLEIGFYVWIVIRVVRARKTFSGVFVVEGLFSRFVFVLVVFVVSLAGGLFRGVLRDSRSYRLAMFVRGGYGVGDEVSRLCGGFESVFRLVDRVEFSWRVPSVRQYVVVVGGRVLRIGGASGIVLYLFMGEGSYRFIFARGVGRFVRNAVSVDGYGVCTEGRGVFHLNVTRVRCVMSRLFFVELSCAVLVTSVRGYAGLFFYRDFIHYVQVCTGSRRSSTKGRIGSRGGQDRSHRGGLSSQGVAGHGFLDISHYVVLQYGLSGCGSYRYRGRYDSTSRMSTG